jgi:hypothetical protein
MGDRVVDCARLESVCAERHRGVRIPPIRCCLIISYLRQPASGKTSIFMTKVMTCAGKCRDVC